jgi:RimJ/RimL family protein N-acetyltransferase
MYKHKNKIKLSKISFDDLAALKDLKDESWFGTHNVAIVNSEDQENWFKGLDSKKTLILSAMLNETKIGYYKLLNIDWVNRRYDMSYDVIAGYRGKGYSSLILEAGIDFGFEILNMHRIDTEVLENNIASHRSLIKSGFIQEGVKRKAIYRCGDYLNSIILGILVEDWASSERVVANKGVCNDSYKPKNDIDYGK